ncbi:MAG: RidA family protein [Sphingobacteriales bacterium]|jgi:enamine deaminase RidA (YjgF/YER057c/UK114 family)|nr:MAG: RidA family protein [Sphingobacteriales bacterium]
MSKRVNYLEGSEWETKIGYCRAVKIGNTIEIAGTTATVNGEVVGKGDMYLQTKTILQKFEKVLAELGASMNDVVRTRIFCTDISRWEEIGKAHGEYFAEIKPATAMYEIPKLINGDLLVEIEATAILEI